MALSPREGAVGSQVAERLGAQLQPVADVKGRLGGIAEPGVVLARAVGQRALGDQVDQRLEPARLSGQQELALQHPGLVVDALLVFQIPADIDADPRNLAHIDHRLDGHGVQLPGLAGMLFELGDRRDAHPVAEAILELDDRRLLPVQRAAVQPPAAQLQLGHALLHIGAVDLVGEPLRRRRARQAQHHRRRHPSPSTHVRSLQLIVIRIISCERLSIAA